MEMTRLEKWFVNRSRKAERNIARVRQRLRELPSEAIQDVLELGCGIGRVAAYLAATYEMNVYGTDLNSFFLKDGFMDFLFITIWFGKIERGNDRKQ